MERVTVYEMESLYRDSFRVTGFRFGAGEKTLCVVGSMRGNEVQQLYCCSKLVERLGSLESRGLINEGRSITVIPCVNPYSMNIGKRFWPTDNSDINRMFPGYGLGETTQRIADGVFRELMGYEYGIHFASYHTAGKFTPHVRMMRTGFESVDDARRFGLPYVVLVDPVPFDSGVLNYNWQIWETKAFSIYTQETSRIDRDSAMQVVDSVTRFLNSVGAVSYDGRAGYVSDLIDEGHLVSIQTVEAGIFEPLVDVDAQVTAGTVLARILDPYEGRVREEVTASCDGVVFFRHSDPLVYADTVAFKLVPIGEFKAVPPTCRCERGRGIVGRALPNPSVGACRRSIGSQQAGASLVV